MTKLVAITALVALLAGSSGCYLGRTPDAKAAGYVINGSVAALGAGMLGHSLLSNGSCAGHDDNCSDNAFGEGLFLGYGGLALLAVGAVGLLINVLAPLDDRDSSVAMTAGSAHATTAIVTAPGLQPATVRLH